MVLSTKDYRELAQAALLQAASETLPQRRQQHELCAQRWESVAEKAEEPGDRKLGSAAKLLGRQAE